MSYAGLGTLAQIVATKNSVISAGAAAVGSGAQPTVSYDRPVATTSSYLVPVLVVGVLALGAIYFIRRHGDASPEGTSV